MSSKSSLNKYKQITITITTAITSTLVGIIGRLMSMSYVQFMIEARVTFEDYTEPVVVIAY